MTTLESLAARVRTLEDERAILQTLHQYGHAMDYGPDIDFVDCFTAEGVYYVAAPVISATRNAA